jgi:hypothetical protein
MEQKQSFVLSSDIVAYVLCLKQHYRDQKMCTNRSDMLRQKFVNETLE